MNINALVLYLQTTFSLEKYESGRGPDPDKAKSQSKRE